MSTQTQPKGTVLVVDDDETVRSGLYWALTSDYRVLQASSREERYATAFVHGYCARAR